MRRLSGFWISLALLPFSICNLNVLICSVSIIMAGALGPTKTECLGEYYCLGVLSGRSATSTCQSPRNGRKTGSGVGLIEGWECSVQTWNTSFPIS